MLPAPAPPCSSPGTGTHPEDNSITAAAVKLEQRQGQHEVAVQFDLGHGHPGEGALQEVSPECHGHEKAWVMAKEDPLALEAKARNGFYPSYEVQESTSVVSILSKKVKR